VATLSIDEAISRGIRRVNVPVWGLLCVPAVLYVLGKGALERRLGANAFAIVILLAFLACFTAAWLWWSVSLPKWRLWAYERVDDIPELKRRAVAAQLMWPDGSIFSRTEIKSAAHAARESELERLQSRSRVT